MNWSQKSWVAEDELYSPKRNVGNRGSKKRPHIIGAFNSVKMKRVVEYESLNEYVFYSILELDPRTVRYYVQPVEIQLPFLGEAYRQSNWVHVSDVLVFRQGAVPFLYQVKDLSEQLTSKSQTINRYCEAYASDRGWHYEVIHPKRIPQTVRKNAELLMGFLQPRSDLNALIPEVVSRLAFIKTSTVEELALLFKNKAHPLRIVPVIYHLIAIGKFETDVTTEINQWSEIRLRAREYANTDFFCWEGQP